MSKSFRLSGYVSHVGRKLALGVSDGDVFNAAVQLDETIDDGAAVTPLIGTYPGALESINVEIGKLRLKLQATHLSKISKRIDEPYAYILEAQLIHADDDGAHMRGTLEIILMQRTDAAPLDDDDSLAPPMIAHYKDKHWRIWLAVEGGATDKIEGPLNL